MTGDTSPPAGADGARRFHMNLGNPFLRVFFLALLTWRSNSYVEVTDRTVEFRMGPLFRLRVPRDHVQGARSRGWPSLLGWGWRYDLRGTVGLIGTRSGVVEVSLGEPRWVRLVILPVRCRRVAASLEAPQALIDALGEVATAR